MNYVDKEGKSFEISYSQRMQREQIKLMRQRNQLLFTILMILILFGFGAVWIVFRLAYSDVLSTLIAAL